MFNPALMGCHTLINDYLVFFSILVFSFSALTLLVGRQKGHSACKKFVYDLTGTLHSYSCGCHHHFHYPNWLQIKSANPGSPGKMTIKTERVL